MLAPWPAVTVFSTCARPVEDRRVDVNQFAAGLRVDLDAAVFSNVYILWKRRPPSSARRQQASWLRSIRKFLWPDVGLQPRALVVAQGHALA